jgi:hypothetical protein
VRKREEGRLAASHAGAGKRGEEMGGGGPGSVSVWEKEKKQEGGVAVDSAGGAALSKQGSVGGL